MSGMKLAKYDFRSKQEYIYRTNKVKEIVGASEIITCAYNDFFDALRDKGIIVDNGIAVDGKCPEGMACAFEPGSAPRYINNPDMEFSAVFPEGLSGRIIYIGGGNLYMLWKDEETAEKASGVLCRMLREKAYSLSAVCGMADYSGDYAADMKNLNADFERCKVLTPPFIPSAMLPFTELDRRTSLPIAHKSTEPGMEKYTIGEESISQESYLKRAQYRKTHGDKRELLDDMITEKGRESLLAVIYFDGNNMGTRVTSEMDGIKDYKIGVKTIRSFSNRIQDCFVSATRAAIECAAESDPVMKDKIRWIVSGGDEVTLICNARAALKIVGIYFDALAKTGENNTACAGIAVFHSHFPFSKAYEIAEECCENAKKKNRRNGSCNCIVDFQYIYAGVIGELELMRQQDGEYMARPYFINSTGGKTPDIMKDFISRANRLRDHIGRANIKEMASRLFGNDEGYSFEIARLDAQYPKAGLKSAVEEDKRFLLDIAQFYDIWFSKEVAPDISQYYGEWFGKEVCK